MTPQFFQLNLGGAENGSEEEEEEEDQGSMEMHPDIDNNENWFGGDENEEDTDDEETGSVQLNDVENSEEYETQSVEYKVSDDEEEDTQKLRVQVDENVDTQNQNHSYSPSLNEYEIERINSTRNKRLAAMKNATKGGLDGLRTKYQKQRVHREQLSEVDAPWSLSDLTKAGDDGEEDVDLGQNNDDDGDENKNDIDYDDNRSESEEEEEDDDLYGCLQSHKRKSVLLDINQFSMSLAAVVEEDDDDDEDDDGCFQMKTYETDSDCDSNDSVVIKKEIVTNVTSDALNDLQKDSLSIV